MRKYFFSLLTVCSLFVCAKAAVLVVNECPQDVVVRVLARTPITTRDNYANCQYFEVIKIPPEMVDNSPADYSDYYVGSDYGVVNLPDILVGADGDSGGNFPEVFPTAIDPYTSAVCIKYPYIIPGKSTSKIDLEGLVHECIPHLSANIADDPAYFWPAESLVRYNLKNEICSSGDLNCYTWHRPGDVKCLPASEAHSWRLTCEDRRPISPIVPSDSPTNCSKFIQEHLEFGDPGLKSCLDGWATVMTGGRLETCSAICKVFLEKEPACVESLVSKISTALKQDCRQIAGSKFPVCDAVLRYSSSCRVSPLDPDSPPAPIPPVPAPAPAAISGGAVAGAAVGIVAVTSAVIAAVWWRRSPRRKLKVKDSIDGSKALGADDAETISSAESLKLTISSSKLSTADPLLEWVASRSKNKERSQLSDTTLRSQYSGSGLPAHLEELEFAWEDATVLNQLGVGSFGKVFLAKLHQTPVALKVLVDAKAVEEASSVSGVASFKGEVAQASRENLVREVNVMSSLRHPNVALLLGFCLAPPALAIEYCGRGSLYDVLRRARDDQQLAVQLTWQRRVRMAADAAAGILHLHTRSIIHRDLKSPNLLVAADDRWTVKVADFGLGKLLSEATGTATSSASGASNPRWLANEVLDGSQATAASDAFSFGICMWELLTWRLPWGDANNVWGIAGMVIRGERLTLPPFSELPGFGAEKEMSVHAIEVYAALMKRCWDQNPADRPSFQTIAAELRFLEGE